MLNGNSKILVPNLCSQKNYFNQFSRVWLKCIRMTAWLLITHYFYCICCKFIRTLSRRIVLLFRFHRMFRVKCLCAVEERLTNVWLCAKRSVKEKKIEQNAIDEPSEFKHVYFEFRYILYLRKAWFTYNTFLLSTHFVDGMYVRYQIKCSVYEDTRTHTHVHSQLESINCSAKAVHFCGRIFFSTCDKSETFSKMKKSQKIRLYILLPFDFGHLSASANCKLFFGVGAGKLVYMCVKKWVCVFVASVVWMPNV